MGESTRAPKVHTRTELTYNDYLKVPELLALQQPLSSPPHHDEMLFIVIHQAYELWFKLLLHEVAQAMRAMGDLQVLQARHFLDRSAVILRLLVQQIHVLETLRPIDFLQFRDLLNPASGFQSLQFRQLEFAIGLKNPAYLGFFKNRPDQHAVLARALEEPSLRDAYYGLLGRLGFEVPVNVALADLEADPTTRAALCAALVPVYSDPESNHPLYLLTESLVDLDLLVALWREHHVRVVERVIGAKIGTGGSSGVSYLRSTTSKQAFPELWDVRTRLEKLP